ncbi:MAG TPA: TIGR01777 family oxidoreductase [Bacteroidia bacterium]|nr:TIGR01777 family oxidoreductase [Bacteroidia bacterium]
MSKILISGGSGAIGRALTDFLRKKGHTVNWLGREAFFAGEVICYKWDPIKGIIDPGAFHGVEHLIHLAGCNIAAQPWTKARKTEIRDSRIKSAEFLYQCARKHAPNISSLIGFSAIGYYGIGQGEQLCQEDSSNGEDFLAKTCVDWEKAYDAFVQADIRCTVLRVGLVLGPQMGIYRRLKPFYILGLGASIGDPNQWLSWIHLHDLCRLVDFTIDNPRVSGVYNAVASLPVRSGEFSTQLAKSLKRPVFLPAIPERVLKIFLGERASIICRGIRASNQKILNTGFRFVFNTLTETLHDLNTTMSIL